MQLRADRERAPATDVDEYVIKNVDAAPPPFLAGRVTESGSR
ncbi:hypothetical protein [Nonomuraea sp. PA05]|nr:hypothetical protein [Nonomuraea sp. PA05]